MSSELLQLRRVGWLVFFFFQAEDGIRDYKVTGVQTCALPILRELCVGAFEAVIGIPVELIPRDKVRRRGRLFLKAPLQKVSHRLGIVEAVRMEIGRASCRERV